jgi:dTDP-glucose 4,6-dehydratase
MDELLDRPEGTSKELITFVKDRPGHDRRYAIDASKLANELNWEPAVAPLEGLRLTAQWYLSHQEWLRNVTSGAYLNYYQTMYENR